MRVGSVQCPTLKPGKASMSLCARTPPEGISHCDLSSHSALNLHPPGWLPDLGSAEMASPGRVKGHGYSGYSMYIISVKYVYIYIYMLVCMYVYIELYMYTHIHVVMYVYICENVFMCIYI